MNKLTGILVSVILIIFAILLYTQAAPKSDDITKELPPQQTNEFQALDLSTTHSTSSGQTTTGPQPTVGVEEGLKASYSATIVTTKGNIVITMISQTAPNTIANFLKKAESNFYNNLTFHRVEDWVIQGGDPKGNGTGGGQMQTEINDLSFQRGSVGVARGNNINISNDAQFFITKTDAPWLTQKYTNLGTVTEGMDVVDKIKKGDRILKIMVDKF